MDLNLIQSRLNKFAKDRDWEQFHSPKNLVMALSVEVAELVEIFQWSNSGGLDEIKNPEIKVKIEKEIADIFNYLSDFNFELIWYTIEDVSILRNTYHKKINTIINRQ